MKAWAFYRRSTDKQELSVDDQRKECRAFAAARGLQIVREFEPQKGWGSGLTIDQDPSFLQMAHLAESKVHGVKFLIVYDVSRLGRLPQEDKIYWEQYFKKRGGIQIVYAKDDFKNDGSIGDTLLKVIKHSEAHQYSMKLSEVTLRGAKSHAALGHFTGGSAPFGYDRLLITAAGDPVKVLYKGEHKADTTQRVILKPSPLTAPIVREIFESHEKGMGIHSLATMLNARQVPAPRGRHWSHNQIHHILRNRAYLGERIYNRTSYKAYRRGEKGLLHNEKEAWITAEKAHEPIIDKDLFDRVQAKKRPMSIGRPYGSPYLLSGIVICGNCGYRFWGAKKKGNGHTYVTYTCSGYMSKGTTVCRSVNVRADELEAVVMKAIEEEFSKPGLREDIREMLNLILEEEYGTGASDKAASLEGQLKDVNRQITNIVGAIKSVGRLSVALSEELAALETQKESIQAKLSKAEARSNQQIGAESLAERIMGTLTDFSKLWKESMSMEERKELLKTVVRQVNVRRDGNKIEAQVWLKRIPEGIKKFPSLTFISKGNCGGPIGTLQVNPPPELIPLLISSRIFALKPPYTHQNAA